MTSGAADSFASSAPLADPQSAHESGAAWVDDTAQTGVRGLPADASGVVLGAPGTGKTSTLVARAAHLLTADGGLDPEEIVVLTPTRQTATALRDRLALAVGRATPGPLARSFASFAYQLVRAATVQRGEEPPQLLTAGDQDRVLADLLAGDDEDATTGADRWPAEIGPAVRGSRTFRTELRTLAAECTELGIEPAELAALGTARGRAGWVAAASFLTEYRYTLAGMRAAHRDSADLLREAAVLLGTAAPGHGAEAMLGLPARLRAVLVDDAQELTRGGIRLLDALRARGVAVLAFGDPDIGSGAFRGASPALFGELCDLLGVAGVLETPHRFQPGLTRLTRVVTASIGASGRVEHRRAPGPEVDDGSVRTIVSPSPFEEVDRVARTLREWHVVDEIGWGSMAVIAHDTRQVAALEAELAAREVPTRAAGVQRPLGREQVVRDLVEFVRLGMRHPDERDADSLTSVLLSPFGSLDAVGMRRLRARLRHAELAGGGSRPARELLGEAMARPLELGLIDTPEARAAERVATTLEQVHREVERGATAHELLWLVWERARDSGGRPLARVWHEAATGGGVLSAELSHALDALVALFDAAKRFVERSPEDGPEAFVHRILDSDVPEDILTAPERIDTVTLLTPAAALGTEFDAVVIAGMQEGVWPNLRLRGGLLDTWRLEEEVAALRAGRSAPEAPDVRDRRRGALHDELRLFVRALSRARSRVVVTAVDDDDLGPSPLLSFLPDPDDEPSSDAEHPLTLRGLVAQHRRTLTSSRSELARVHAAGQLAILTDERVPGAAPSQWYGLSRSTSDRPLRDPDRGPVHVSPSRVEGFDACGLDWAIRALGGDTRSWSAGLGTILHAALEEVPGGERAALQAVVDGRWGELDFEAPWMDRKEQAWARVLVDRLHAYLVRFHHEGGRTIGAEARFRLAIELDADEPAVTAVETDRDPLPAGRFALLSGSVDRVEVYPGGRGEGVPVDPAHPDAERVMIVDLKTGRSESRVADDKVAEDPQLAAYQLAFLEGQVDGADPAAGAGARLLVLSKTLKNTHYRMAHQPAMDAASRRAFLEAVVRVARGMASESFDAHLDTHCRKDPFAVCGIHTVKAVSAS